MHAIYIYSFISNVFKEIDLEITDCETFGRPFKSVKHSLNNKFKKSYLLSIQWNSTENILNCPFDCGKLKSEIKLEDYMYLINESPLKSRQVITKLWVSDHILEIETGRYKLFLEKNRSWTRW